MSDFLAVDLPNVDTPDAKDGVGWLEKGVDYVTNMSADAWKLVVIGVGAALILWLFRRSPMLKGVAIGVALLAIVMAIYT